MRRHRRVMGASALLIFLLTGCGVHVPADPHGTTDRAHNGVLRVGATEEPPWVVIEQSDTPEGTEVDLVTGFAETLDAEIEWTTGSEARLLQALERGELDVVIGGFLDDTPWSDRAAVTRPYAEESTSDGVDKHVLLVRMGENRLLTDIETFLHEEVGS